MRYDQSIRALKTLLTRGELGQPVLATIEMRAIPHWMPWARQYDRTTFLIMSIHHLDVFRYLFGDPESVYASARTDPRATFPHRDGIVALHPGIRERPARLRLGRRLGRPRPRRRRRGYLYQMARRGHRRTGPRHHRLARLSQRRPQHDRIRQQAPAGCWISPRWNEVWFPDAFEGTMGELLASIAEERTPVISAGDNMNTMALVEACYRSLDEHRPVSPKEIIGTFDRSTGEHL